MLNKDFDIMIHGFSNLCTKIAESKMLTVANASLFVDYLSLFETLSYWQIPVPMSDYNKVSSIWHPNYVDDLSKFVEIFINSNVFKDLHDMGYTGPYIDFSSLHLKDINYRDLEMKAREIILSAIGGLYAIRELCWILKSYLQMTHNQSLFHSEPYGGVIKMIAIQNTTNYEKFWEYLTCRAVTFDQMLIEHLIPDLMTDSHLYNSLFKIEQDALKELAQLHGKEDKLFSKLSTLKE